MHPVQAAEIIMLAAAVSIDAFAAAFTYGTDGIGIPARSAWVIHLLSTFIICISLISGLYLGEFLPHAVTDILSFLMLLILGIAKLFDGLLKNALQKTENCKKDITFSLMSLHFILSVYANPKTADADRSKILSPKEAAVLAITLSIDSIPIGIGMGLSSFPIWCVIPIAILADEAAIRLGHFFGKKAAEKLSIEASWIGGALLIIMALAKLI